jgi:hypothetical protein
MPTAKPAAPVTTMSFQLRLALAKDGLPSIAYAQITRPTVAVDGLF